MTKCSKRSYRSPAAARKAWRQMSGTSYAAAKYSYKCPNCGFWHLTKQPQRPNK